MMITYGLPAARASDVEVCERRRSGFGCVVTARTTPPTSASVGVWMFGACAPSGVVEPWSSAVTSAQPVAPDGVDRASRQPPGEGMLTVATKYTDFSPHGCTATARTGGPAAAFPAPVTVTSTGVVPSMGTPRVSVTVMMTGSGPPAHTSDEMISGTSVVPAAGWDDVATALGAAALAEGV